MDHIQSNTQMKIGWRDLTEQICECAALLQQIPHQIELGFGSGVCGWICACKISSNIYNTEVGFLSLLHHWCAGKMHVKKVYVNM